MLLSTFFAINFGPTNGLLTACFEILIEFEFCFTTVIFAVPNFEFWFVKCRNVAKLLESNNFDGLIWLFVPLGETENSCGLNIIDVAFDNISVASVDTVTLDVGVVALVKSFGFW